MNYKDKVTPVNENIHQMVTLGLRKSFRQSLNIYIEGEVDRKEFQGNENQRRTSGKIGLTYYYPPRFSCWGEIIYSHLKERGEDATKNRIEGSLGVSYQLPWDIHLYGDVRYNTIHHPQEEELKSKGFQATLRVTKKFFWGKREKIAGLKPGIETKGYGSVEGVVFNDINANGMQEIGEEGIPNVTVSLEDGSKVKTDSKGSYQFPRVESGSHVVNLDVKRIPADYSIISPEKIKIEVKFRETLKVNFQLIKAGRIEGRVINDLNANGKFDPNEKGIPDVLVLLQPGDNNTYTEEDGKFTFENILPGEYTLKLDPNTLSKDAVFTSPSDLKLKLPVGGDLKDMDFMIHIKPRPIMIGPPKK
jgi:hypothetical protein